MTDVRSLLDVAANSGNAIFHLRIDCMLSKRCRLSALDNRNDSRYDLREMYIFFFQTIDIFELPKFVRNDLIFCRLLDCQTTIFPMFVKFDKRICNFCKTYIL